MKNLTQDNATESLMRGHITQFILSTHQLLKEKTGKLLEVGPQERSLVRETFTNFDYKSLDIVGTFNPTYIGDITKPNKAIPDQEFDCIICMEVLEHCLQPFDAIAELRRMLKDGGVLVLSSPLNWRIHGPVPDCWRFTEHGYKVLLKDFDDLEIDSLETPDRDLFPIHYNVRAVNNVHKNISAEDLKFRLI